MNKAVKVGLSKEEVREEWDRFLQNNRGTLTLHGKPLVPFPLDPHPSWRKTS